MYLCHFTVTLYEVHYTNAHIVCFNIEKFHNVRFYSDCSYIGQVFIRTLYDLRCIFLSTNFNDLLKTRKFQFIFFERKWNTVQFFWLSIKVYLQKSCYKNIFYTFVIILTLNSIGNKLLYLGSYCHLYKSSLTIYFLVSLPYTLFV